MKKLLTLLFVLCAITAQAQIPSIYNDPHKYADHAVIGFITGSSVHLGTYKLLSNHTKLPLFVCKTAAVLAGMGAVYLAANLKENSDSFRNQNDIKYSMYGAGFGAVLIGGLLVIDMPLSRLSDKQRKELNAAKNDY